MDWLCVISIFANAGMLLVIWWLADSRDQYKGGVARLEREVEALQYNVTEEKSID